MHPTPKKINEKQHQLFEIYISLLNLSCTKTLFLLHPLSTAFWHKPSCLLLRCLVLFINCWVVSFVSIWFCVRMRELDECMHDHMRNKLACLPQSHFLRIGLQVSIKHFVLLDWKPRTTSILVGYKSHQCRAEWWNIRLKILFILFKCCNSVRYLIYLTVGIQSVIRPTTDNHQ